MAERRSEREPSRLDRRSVRLAFERAAATYDNAAVLQREVGQRLAERLGVIRLQPAVVLDAGCGTGDAMGELRTRYPEALLIGLDLALNMTVAARARLTQTSVEGSLLRRVWALRALRAPARAERSQLICGDVGQLPLAPDAVDMVWSNLCLQWVDDLPRVFAEFRRVLKVDGLLSFTTFGPDTLKELRAAFAAVDGGIHINRFVDMHDVGDMLIHAGFGDPVIDMEVITVTYTDPLALMRELKAIGAHNANADRRRGLTGRQGWQRMLAALDTFRRDGRIPATYEIVYGHAWKPKPRISADGRAIVRFERGRGTHT